MFSFAILTYDFCVPSLSLSLSLSLSTIRMANDNGYILMAMDWRGMSRFDLPVVIKTLIGNPNLFQSIRDNLIQGYANKLVLQHFARYAMLDWLKIDGASIPTLNDERPASVFYG